MSKKANNFIIAPEVLRASISQSLEGAEEKFVLLGFDYNKYFYYLSRLLNLYPIVGSSLKRDFNVKLSAAINRLQNDNSKNAKLIIIGGLKTNSSNLALLNSNNFKTIYWYTDSVNRFEHVECQNQSFDKVLYHDGGDFDKSNHQNKQWVPYGFNHFYYTIGKDQTKDIDILFTGYLKQPEYKMRLEYFNRLMNSDLPKKYKVVGAVTTRDTQLKKQIISSGIEYVGRVVESEYARYIKRSKVVVNIMQDDGLKPINPLFFAIPYAKTVQITNKFAYLGKWLRPGIHYLEAEKEAFIAALEEACKEKVSLELDEAYLLSAKNTLRNRLKTLLNE